MTLAESSPKPHEPVPSNAIPRPLQINELLIDFLFNLTVTRKQLFNTK